MLARTLSRQQARVGNETELERLSGRLAQLDEFQNRYYENHRAELEKDGSANEYKRLQKELEDLARRCAASGQANAAETTMRRMFFASRQNITRLLNDFAPVCDRLAELANESLTGRTLTDEDANWIKGYGVTLARFHFYYGNSYEVPRDDFPMVTRVFSNPLTDSMLYAGLARPQALYVIAPDGASPQLYRGAVLTYREFIRPNDQLLDDESWRELISKGQTPPAPPFTRSFLAARSVVDWMQALREVEFDSDVDAVENILWHLETQAADQELPELIRMMVAVPDGTNANRIERWIVQVQEGTWVTNDVETIADWVSEVRDGLSGIIARLPWESCQSDLIPLLASTNAALVLAKLGATNAAPALLATFQARLQSPEPSPEDMQRQVLAVTEGARPYLGDSHYDLLDPDRLERRFTAPIPTRAKEMTARRLPPQWLRSAFHGYNFVDALIEALGELGYTAATDELFTLRGGDHDVVTTRALNKLAPDRLGDELLATATDKQLDSFLRERALVTLCDISATNRVRDLVPLLDDTTPIEYERPLPGPEWRICDRAAASMAVLLGWESRMMPFIHLRPEQPRRRDEASAGMGQPSAVREGGLTRGEQSTLT